MATAIHIRFLGLVVLCLGSAAAVRAEKIVLVAGGGEGGNGGPAREARLQMPFAVDFDRSGNLFLAEYIGQRVRKIDRKGILSTIAGTGEKGYGGDDGPAAKSLFNSIHSIAAANGDIYIADSFNKRLRKIDGRTGAISTVAGTGEKGFSGDGGPGNKAQFGDIYCVAFDAKGEKLYLADLDNRRIRVLDVTTGMVDTVAGNGEKGVPRDGADARKSPLVDPRAVAVDARGNVYILERSGHALRVVDAEGKIRTVAGTGKAGLSGDGGDALRAQFNGPKHLCVDPNGDVLIADTENHVIRKYLPREGKIVRLAGTGRAGRAGLDGPPLKAELNQPHGVNALPDGTIYISDSSNNRVLKIEPTPKAKQEGEVRLLRVPNKGIQPQVVRDDQGVLHLIYFQGDPRHGDIYYVRSENEGSNFSRPLRVNSVPESAIAIGNIRGAHLAVGKNGRIHVVWTGSGRRGPADQGMFYTRRNHEGTAFESQRNVIAAAKTPEGGSVAADDSGHVYVIWHTLEPGCKGGEESRRVWVAISTDDGKTFAPEKAAFGKETGVCGCCGLHTFADRKGNLYVLFRSAAQHVHRDTYLLISKDKGARFRGEDLHPWKIEACPMSSYAFAEGPQDVLAAWETNGQVYFARIDPATGKSSTPVAAPGESRERKHPVIASNKQGQILMAWTEGMGWERGGSVAWQVFDKDGKPTTENGRADGVPVWSLVAVFPRADGGFTIVY